MKKKFLKKIIFNIFGILNLALNKAGLSLVRTTQLSDFHLHQYLSYDEYRQIQVSENIRKINNIWADEKTLALVFNTLFPKNTLKTQDDIKGLCHGARNGFEQSFFNNLDNRMHCIGTDISETAATFPNSIVHDFHENKIGWFSKFDFVYSNSLDHAWDPKMALLNWVNQVKVSGSVVVELTKTHGPLAASRLDPFGVKPEFFPYFVIGLFGNQVSLSLVKSVKSNNQQEVWLFFIKRNVKRRIFINEEIETLGLFTTQTKWLV